MSFIVIYCILQLINVILSTIKSILTINGNKWWAATSNAIYYGFYTIIIIWSVSDEISLWGKIIISSITNFIGTYIARLITEKLRKDKLWEIIAVVKYKGEEAADKLADMGIIFTRIKTSKDNLQEFHIFSHTKKESKLIKSLLDTYNSYYIVHEENFKLN